MLKTIVCAAALMGAVPFSVSATAPTPRSVAVQTGDLDLVREEGRAVLGSRIRGAVKTVCARSNVPSDMDLAQRRECRLLSARAARRDARILIAQRMNAAALASR